MSISGIDFLSILNIEIFLYTIKTTFPTLCIDKISVFNKDKDPLSIPDIEKNPYVL